MRASTGPAAAALMALVLSAGAHAATIDDFVFIHHSCGNNWLSNSLHAALLAKDYIDERNDIYYGTDLPPDTGRPDSLAPTPGDRTNMNHWVPWLNDYLAGVKAHGCATGVNRIIMFKSCYPISNIGSDGTEPGDPFSPTQSLVNYKAVFRHPDGAGNTYSHSNGYTYRPLEDIFADNPDTLFIFCTAPPRHYTGSNDDDAHRARLFNNWVKTDWLDSYNTAHPGLNNVAVFDWFDFLAYPDDHPDHPNRLKGEYGGSTSNSHPNTLANQESTAAFATDPDNFIDPVWALFTTSIQAIEPLTGPPHTCGLITGAGLGATAGTVKFTPDGGIEMDWEVLSWSDSEVAFRVPAGTPLGSGQVRVVRADSASSNSVAFAVTDPATLHVDAGNTTGVENASAAYPFNTIQEGINAATNEDTVQVADGTYCETEIDFGGKAITVRSDNGPAHCVIDCQQAGRGVHFQSGEGPEAVLEGLTIRNGYTVDQGGGIRIDASSPTLVGNVIEGCTSEDEGGGIYCRLSASSLVRNLIVDNRAAGCG